MCCLTESLFGAVTNSSQCHDSRLLQAVHVLPSLVSDAERLGGCPNQINRASTDPKAPKSIRTSSPGTTGMGVIQVPVVTTCPASSLSPNWFSSLAIHVKAMRGSPKTLAPVPLETSCPFRYP